MGYEADYDKILKLYTKETILYKVINNLSRIAKSSLELFYLQPLIKDLSKAVKFLYSKQEAEPEKSNFTCYRGALLSYQEK